MYPHKYFELFPPFPREDSVFVAMSFDERLRSRWETVIDPGIRDVRVDGVMLKAHRVDVSRVGDSILTEILDGVSKSRLVLADVTALEVAGHGEVRNANVMYEVGLAHAVRLPEEVLLFRSDSKPILFDIANVRINSYDPDGAPDNARCQVKEAIESSLREVDLKRHMAVTKAAQSIDALAWDVLDRACEDDGVGHFDTRSIAKALSGIPRNATIVRLLELGALETDCAPQIRQIIRSETRVDPALRDSSLFTYRPTPFGRAVRSVFRGRGVQVALEEGAAQIVRKIEAGSNPSVRDGPRE